MFHLRERTYAECKVTIAQPNKNYVHEEIERSVLYHECVGGAERL